MGHTPAGYRNLWALTVLSLLRLRPMHPYEISTTLRSRGKVSPSRRTWRGRSGCLRWRP